MPSPSLPFAMPSYGAYDGSHGHVISLTLYQTTDQDYRLIFANRFRHASLSMCVRVRGPFGASGRCSKMSRYTKIHG